MKWIHSQLTIKLLLGLPDAVQSQKYKTVYSSFLSKFTSDGKPIISYFKAIKLEKSRNSFDNSTSEKLYYILDKKSIGYTCNYN